MACHESRPLRMVRDTSERCRAQYVNAFFVKPTYIEIAELRLAEFASATEHDRLAAGGGKVAKIAIATLLADWAIWDGWHSCSGGCIFFFGVLLEWNALLDLLFQARYLALQFFDRFLQF